MTDQPTCQAADCERPSADGYLCHRCTRVLERILAELPATLTDLQVTITRQSRTSRGGGGKPTKAAESPLPFDVHASDLADRVRNGLSTWIRHLCESRGVERYHGPAHPVGGCQHDSCRAIRAGGPLFDRTEDMATWLVAHIDSIRQDEWAPQLLADLKALQSELRAAVDNREYRYAGSCRAVQRPVTISAAVDGGGERIYPQLEVGAPEPCGADLKARVGAKTIVCRECGAEYDADDQAAWIDKASADQIAPGPVIAHALAEAGYRVKPATIRNWAERTREWASKAARWKPGDPPLAYEEHPIEQVACSVTGQQPLYRVGQVVARVKADPERRQIGA